MYVCWSAYLTRVVVPPIADHIEEGDGTPIFFPFPFTSKVVESRPYKGTDPEWQAYIRIAKDRDLLLKIRNDMLETVRVAAEANPILAHRCGRPIKVRKHWLDLDFPYRPPPKFMRDGLLLAADGSLEYVTTEVDPMTMMRISRALWPAPVALSASSFVSTLVRQNLQHVARFFGFETADGPLASSSPPGGHAAAAQAQKMSTLASTLKRRLEEAEPREQPPKQGEAAAAGSAGAATAADTAGTLPTTTPPVTPSPSSSSSSSSSPDDRILNAKDLIPFESVRASIDDAWGDFKKKLAETWLPLRPQAPGGSVSVSGLVELQSPNSRIMIEVTAFWDPKTRKYDAPTMHMKLRSIRPRNQVPL